MKKLIIILSMLIIATSGQTQSLNWEYVEGIKLGMTKEEVIDEVVKQFNNHFLNDKNGIIKEFRKQKGKKLEKLEDRIAFLTSVETEVRAELERVDDWSQADLNTKWLVHLGSLLGDHLYMPGYGKMSEYPSGYGNVTFLFKDGKLHSVGGLFSMTSSYDTWIGYDYTDERLKTISRLVTENFGNYQYTHSKSDMITHNCRQPSYTHSYTVTSDTERNGWFQFVFQPFGERYKEGSVYKCRYIQHQLDDIHFHVSLKK